MTSTEIEQLRDQDLAKRKRKRDAKQRADDVFKVTIDGNLVLETARHADAMRRAYGVKSGVVFVTDSRNEVIFTRVT